MLSPPGSGGSFRSPESSVEVRRWIMMAEPERGNLNASERKLLLLIQAGDQQEVAELLAADDVRINCLDERSMLCSVEESYGDDSERQMLLKCFDENHLLETQCHHQYGMTPLMHAAYKGEAAVCDLLLQGGADVNSHQHEFGYTALMFAGLSGKTDVTSMMLDAGAETDQVNSVGRTAAQMAAFVGQHQCVRLINSFFSRARLELYTQPCGLEAEPRLPPCLAEPLHKIIMTSNLNPVKIVLLVKEDPALVDAAALEKCSQVLELLCEQNIQQQDMNEVLIMKIHYIRCVLQECVKFLRNHDPTLDTLVKSLLRGRESDGFPQNQEKFIRDCIRKFPYCEASLLQQLGSEPTAFSVLTQALTGQMTFVDADYCSTCGEKGADKRCSLCKAVMYCSSMCQKLHWFAHKKICRVLQEQDGSLEDGSLEDGSLEDGSLEDGRVEDGRVEDGSLEDGRVEDGSLEDGSLEDSRVEDGSLEDGSLEDGRVEDGPRFKELKEDQSDLTMETAHFLQELCLRAEEKMAAAAGCPAELFSRSSASADEPPVNQD